MPELRLFDGMENVDRIEKISIDYHRVTKIKPGVIPDGATWEYATWDYSEHLAIDRKSETLEHIQNIGAGCKVSHQYYVEEGIATLLDDIDIDEFFSEIQGNPPEVINDPLETKDYIITVDFLYGEQRVITGTFDKNGLPSDYPEFIEDIFNFMQFYGMGEILDPSVYEKAKRSHDDYIFCSVVFQDGGKSYYYLTEDESLAVGDCVYVPAGKHGNMTEVKIVNIEYFDEDSTPFPIEKMKSIIGLAEKFEADEEIVPKFLSKDATVFCPVLQRQCTDVECLEIFEVAEQMIKPQVLTWINNNTFIWDEHMREVCLGCRYNERNLDSKVLTDALMYSDVWIKQGRCKEEKIELTNEVNCVLWRGRNENIVGVGIDFEITNDTHYELLWPDWTRFMAEVLGLSGHFSVEDSFEEFKQFLLNGNSRFDFEEKLGEMDIPYKKFCYY